MLDCCGVCFSGDGMGIQEFLFFDKKGKNFSRLEEEDNFLLDFPSGWRKLRNEYSKNHPIHI
jgi:hypothetical protein